MMLLVLTACGDSEAEAPTAAGGDGDWCVRYDHYLSVWRTIYDDLGLDPEIQEDSRAAAVELLPLWMELQADAPSAVRADVEFIRTVFDDEIDPSIDWGDIRWSEYDRAMNRINEFCA